MKATLATCARVLLAFLLCITISTPTPTPSPATSAHRGGSLLFVRAEGFLSSQQGPVQAAAPQQPPPAPPLHSPPVGHSEISLLQQQQHLLQQHGRMSCFACSTMDYESPTDNACRWPKPPPSHPPPQSPLSIPSQLHFTTHRPTPLAPPSASTTASTTASSLDGAELTPQAEALVAAATTSAGLAYEPADESTLASGSPQPAGRMMNDTTIVNATLTKPPQSPAPPTGRAKANWTNNEFLRTLGPSSRRRVVQPRPFVQSNYISTRQCAEEENFCSIVSVVRIEFVQDNIYSKFWALERNCSRSCNTGCMMIGERVRLRVCSQCCRTPDCNVGGGAAPRLARPAFNQNGPLLTTCLVLLLTARLVLDTTSRASALRLVLD